LIGCGSKRVKDRFIRTGMSRSSENVEKTSPAFSAIMKELPLEKDYVGINLDAAVHDAGSTRNVISPAFISALVNGSLLP